MTIKDICEKFNITEANYYALIRKYNIQTPLREHLVNVSNITKEEIQAMQKEGMTKKEIAKTLGIGIDALTYLQVIVAKLNTAQ